jgi:gamma-glutamyl phosphate reductase
MGLCDGVCHVYADERRRIEKGLSIIGTPRHSMRCLQCGETLLVHKRGRQSPAGIEKSMDEKAVILRGCEQTRKIINCDRIR